ncbi:MAG TPA: SDR family NAD(P)-dependent oxidoreductase [Patescibacteria group bacterium]|nr:SDR family NAD(P)-dependent oxidoreductase [Patescibacteria group bacterium]
MQIKDKVIVITGASEGIGQATARVLAGAGAKVVLVARNKEKLDQLAAELPGSLAMPTDMRKALEVKRMIDETAAKFGRIDVLINNAGQGMSGPVENISLDDYREMMELNVYGVVCAMQAAIPHMRRQGGGMILNISSRVSKNYFPNLAAYASTKYALNALSLTARQELAADHIIVSVFHPKMTATDFGKNSLGRRMASAPQPASRSGMEIDTPEQVAVKIAEQIESEEPEAAM